MMRRALPTALVLIAILAIASVASAGGPFVVDMLNETGSAQRWEDDTLPWSVDPGPLSDQIDNAEARDWITEALAKWTGVTIPNADLDDVSTSTIATRFSGVLDEDVDETNYTQYISSSPGETAIIFDTNGDIVAALVGEQNRDMVVGLSQPLLSDSSGLHIIKGVVILNGRLQSNGVLAADQDDANDLFKATVLHELGHLLNLDHAQTNFDVAQGCTRDGSCPDAQFIPTMYPQLLTPRQGDLSREDKIAISWIYPSAAFESDFCTITGEIFDSDGNPLKGVNVIAQRVSQSETMQRNDTRSYVSGVLYPGCSGDSRYNLHGIVPGQQYQVTYEPIGSEFTGASDFEPLDNPPRGFDGGTIAAPDGATTVSCDEGGETIEMAAVTIDVTNPCTGSGGSSGDDGDGDDGASTTGTKSCRLLRDTPFSNDLVATIALLVAIVVGLGLLRHRLIKR